MTVTGETVIAIAGARMPSSYSKQRTNHVVVLVFRRRIKGNGSRCRSVRCNLMQYEVPCAIQCEWGYLLSTLTSIHLELVDTASAKRLYYRYSGRMRRC